MVVLGVLELALDVVALVLLVRTPRERVTMPKWAWALLIIFINLIGSILFLAIGRRPAAAVDPLTTGAQTGDAAARPSSASVADALYGSAPGTGGAEPGSTTSNGDDGNAP
ncbi:PLDc_N domain-containing protein [Humibacter ginsenosidimutans]|uniref:PLDc_N domain-containing protein n=2 Tax=Humibacter ginsenosidimutans TaxID=2599293 RepID=A0A5B8M9B5_9MICO|nr:PLDc_N domain-containing protein [Humibacter ginsenosidimutans]